MHLKRFRHRARLGVSYARKYLMDEFSDASESKLVPAKPVDVGIAITYNCNLACPTCFRWTSEPDEHELNLEEWKIVIAKLKAWLGAFNLSFTGGEPFSRKDLLDIFKFASKNGVVTSVTSNGSLIDKTLARKIIASGLDGVSLSLNSLKREVHNKTRGTNGSFDEVMTAIENLRKREGMRLSLSTTVVRENISELPDVVEFVSSNGLYGVHFQPIMPATALPTYDKDGHFKKVSAGTPYRDLLKRKEVIDDAGVDHVFDSLISMKERGNSLILNSSQHLKEMAKYLKDPTNPEILEKVCQVGLKNFNIDPFGNVRLCTIMEVVGNVTKNSPAEIWRSANASSQRENIRTCEKTCRLLFCNYKELDFKHKVKRVVNSITN
jgi:MoaA/NifB/PqqE/SkfB family radical SAM enzyme